ncbi:hypothetical protein M1329_00815 [Candidatus Marsarchaeota archaeon]|jgi:uncharacterized membrane protein YqjE|nr:hypothetical protein [Candidatus Marsarchaeota archaeon]MCL5100235.1 hypothetical protein [Candidatus Marsarchaeota archaeon]
MARFTGIALSLATIALVIIAIAVFIAFGGTLLFYALVIAAIVIGMLNTWFISREQSQPRPAPVQATAARSAGARQRKRKR